MGKALSRYPRESFFLADKFPGYDVDNIRADRVVAIFEEQLRRCGVEYFDFYLFHNVYERNVEPYLDPENRVVEYLLEQKRNGRIRHLGFSAHGALPVIRKFLDAVGEHMEFGQLQLNYLDWDFQQARDKAAELNRRNIPIWVMEPLRGGKLACGGAVVAKVAKPAQDNRFDMPAVGLKTLETMVEVKASALVIEAGRTLLVDREKTLELADRQGITIVAM